MAISSIGVGSGLPLDALLSDLRKAENRPLSLIESRAASTHKKLGAYDSIKGAVQSLRSAAQALAAPATFGALAVNSQSNAVTAKASTAAIAGKYAISIQQLATHQTLASTGQADREARLANGSVSITFAFATGEPRTITLSQSETSLDGIVKAINGYTGAGLNATLINDGSNSPHRLLLTTADSGTDNEV
ncbi:flagellar filament capping protein FliD [Allopusillimonas ginsengisoli]|uniref:flagellar filament capping protein FliD n=1 Tax=Allopusillimonas ginsengisoli TaxID=453575 RepID=UPI0010207CEC|nr:flagellar cap protein FliD N-terminal domain-containing protein [Allopusillimonas ginsengisoli]TEA79390.1 hypothetical protein ERE07_00055 [Allopusillimonas ginsengisoli]